MKKFPQEAFTLVELSIVLVILGLLVGGVLSGQSLIHAAELRSVTREYTQYVTAANSFRDKYMALPGDIPNATAFWGAADSDPTTCINTASAGTETCNGDGDGKIRGSGSEEFRFWQHLANGGLIEGHFSGTAYNTSLSPGVNLPSSKIAAAGWLVKSLEEGDLGNDTPDAYGNSFAFGDTSDSGGPWDELIPVLKAEDAYGIDTKMDDGIPNRGSIRALLYTRASYTPCANPDGDAYLVSNSTVSCSLFFTKAF